MDMREDFIRGIAMFICQRKELWEKNGAYQKASKIFSDLAASGQIYYSSAYEGLRFRTDFDLTTLAV